MKLQTPPVDPAPIFDIFRGNYATELLTAAVAHFHVFEELAEGPVSFDGLQQRLGLADRPCHVLMTALGAFGLLRPKNGLLELTDLARAHLLPNSPFDISGYVGLAADSPGVREMVERLRTNRPAGAKPEEQGAAFIYREGISSAMEEEASARHLTLALAGRAKNVAPVLAQRVDLDSARLLLDVGGGSGIYSIACLQHNPHLRAIVWDRPEVLKVAQELGETYGVAGRLECRPGDMFCDPLPEGVDVILLSNVLHDWAVPECRVLVKRCADALPTGGRLLIHDVFLNDTLDGPLPIALYSAALFSLTEGRAYSALEYRTWLQEVGLTAKKIIPTLIHCGILEGVKMTNSE
jgi:SAM-dependent methyltransferase